jgi:hypothetical protein
MIPTILTPKNGFFNSILINSMLANNFLERISKTYKMIMVPLMALFLLAACNGDMDSPSNSATINHKIFDEAYAVQYLQTYLLDLNQDGLQDFSIHVMPVGFNEGVKEYFQISSNRDGRILVTEEEITPLTNGIEIGGETAIPGSAWSIFTGSMMLRTVRENQPDQWSGPWAPDRDYFVGLSIRVNGEYHYGWVKLQADKESHAMFVQEFAFQTVPNRTIKAGQRK